MKNERFLSLLQEIQQEKSATESRGINNRVLILDAMNTYIRAFSVSPAVNDNGIHIGGITGFFLSVGYAIRMIKPSRCIIVFDGKGGAQRKRKLFPDYKCGRKPTTRFNRNDFATEQDERQSREQQLLRVVQYLKHLPVTVLSENNVEADDVIAYIATDVCPDSKIVIMSSDKDFLQLVDDRISIWSPTKKIMYTPSSVLEDYGIPAHNFLMYRMLDGDKSDDIPGVNGVGLKSLIKYVPAIIEDHKITIDELMGLAYNHIATEKKPKKMFEHIVENQQLIERNHQLMRLDKVNMSGNTKLSILTTVTAPIHPLVKYQFQTMFLKDTLQGAIPNLDGWLRTTFSTLDSYAQESNK